MPLPLIIPAAALAVGGVGVVAVEKKIAPKGAEAVPVLRALSADLITGQLARPGGAPPSADSASARFKPPGPDSGDDGVGGLQKKTLLVDSKSGPVGINKSDAASVTTVVSAAASAANAVLPGSGAAVNAAGAAVLTVFNAIGTLLGGDGAESVGDGHKTIGTGATQRDVGGPDGVATRASAADEAESEQASRQANVIRQSRNS